MYDIDPSTPNGKFMLALGNRVGRRTSNVFHVATPSGKVVDRFFLSGVNVDNRKLISASLKKWQQLPEADRKPPAIDMDDVRTPAQQGYPVPPPRGIVLRVYMRNLKYDSNRHFARITKTDIKTKPQYLPAWTWGDSIFTEPMPDVVWLTEEEWRSLVPPNPKKGDTIPVAEPIQKRLFRYHLTDATHELGVVWALRDIRSGELTLTVEEVEPVLRLRLGGHALMEKGEGASKSKVGYDARLAGVLCYDFKEKAITQFDFVAVGDCWGSRFKQGRMPLGIAFELAQGDLTAERVAPKGRNFSRAFGKQYFAADKP